MLFHTGVKLTLSWKQNRYRWLVHNIKSIYFLLNLDLIYLFRFISKVRLSQKRKEKTNLAIETLVGVTDDANIIPYNSRDTVGTALMKFLDGSVETELAEVSGGVAAAFVESVDSIITVVVVVGAYSGVVISVAYD